MRMFSHVLSFKYLNILLLLAAAATTTTAAPTVAAAWSFTCFAVCVKAKTKPNCYPNSFSYYVELRAWEAAKIITHTQSHTDSYAHLYNLSAEFFPDSSSTSCWSWQLLLLSDKLSAKLVFELFKLVYFMEFWFLAHCVTSPRTARS